MLKENITYVDYNGVEKTEPFYFNLKKSELMEMELSIKGGLGAYIEKIVAAEDTPAIIAVFKELIAKSYGVKSEDGKRFIKKPELFEEFEQSEAYSELFMKLATDSEYAAKFINGIIPEELRKK